MRRLWKPRRKPQKMNKRIVFFDIDGTLWDQTNYIPPSTIEAIHALQDKGHMAFINTGRTMGFVRDESLLGIGFDGIVAGCGTHIIVRNETRFLHRIETDLAERAVDTVRSFGMRPILEGPEYLYFDMKDFGDDKYGERILREIPDGVLGIADTRGDWNISKFSCAVDHGHLEECRESLASDFDFMVHNPLVIEVVPKGFDKGYGIRECCDILGVDIADTIAFGDSPNDLDMLRDAGLGVAMGDAAHEAKEAADMVCEGLHEDGIYKALRTLKLI